MAGPNLTVFTGSEITAQDFAVLIEQITPTKTGIIYGCTSTIKNSTTIHMSAGWAIVRGRLIRVDDGDISVPLLSSGSATRYLVFKVDLANNDTPVVYSIVDTVPSDSSDFNPRLGVAYMQLASFTVSNRAVTNLVTSVAMPNQPTIRSGTDAPSNSLGVDGDIYIKIN